MPTRLEKRLVEATQQPAGYIEIHRRLGHANLTKCLLTDYPIYSGWWNGPTWCSWHGLRWPARARHHLIIIGSSEGESKRIRRNLQQFRAIRDYSIAGHES